MKTAYLLLLLPAAASAFASDRPSPRFLDPSIQFRAGLDTNPAGTSGTSAAVLGDKDAFTYAGGFGFGLMLTEPSRIATALKLTYAGDVTRFDGWSEENFATHRLGLTGQFALGAWKFSGDGSTLFIDGSRDTLVSVASINANAVPLARERRRQLQHRLKAQTRADFGALMVRATGTVLAYDYQTNVVAGKVAYANRSDAQAALDLGWKQSANSLWIAGIRPGHQSQGTVPLPNCNFEYSNDYVRLAAGWEGKLFGNTTLTFAAGPDFRHYGGLVDTRVFPAGGDRTSLWFEGGFQSKPTPRLTLSGKAARMDWLSSTGKSAYNDSSAETAASWTVNQGWSVRLSAKVHRCDYFPTVRDDWESFYGAGVTAKLSDRALLAVDVLRHRGWNNLPNITEREFQRLVVNFGATLKL